jgi:hypothetical protein
MADLKKVFSIADTDIKKVGTATIGDIKAAFTTLVATDDVTSTTELVTIYPSAGVDSPFQIYAGPTHGLNSWADIVSSSATTQVVFDTSAADYDMDVETVGGRGADAYRNSRAYFLFDLSVLSGTVSSVDSASRVSLHFGTITDSDSSTNIQKWKLFKHNNLTGSLGALDYGNLDITVSATQSSEVTVVSGSYSIFTIGSGDMGTYLLTQAQAKGKIAFMLRNNRDYNLVGPPAVTNSIVLYFADEPGKGPKLSLTYTYT